jgi:hypothetical protein
VEVVETILLMITTTRAQPRHLANARPLWERLLPWLALLQARKPLARRRPPFLHLLRAVLRKTQQRRRLHALCRYVYREHSPLPTFPETFGCFLSIKEQCLER